MNIDIDIQRVGAAGDEGVVPNSSSEARGRMEFNIQQVYVSTYTSTTTHTSRSDSSG